MIKLQLPIFERPDLNLTLTLLFVDEASGFNKGTGLDVSSQSDI
jgi:hypothetical protein